MGRGVAEKVKQRNRRCSTGSAHGRACERWIAVAGETATGKGPARRQRQHGNHRGQSNAGSAAPWRCCGAPHGPARGGPMHPEQSGHRGCGTPGSRTTHRRQQPKAPRAATMTCFQSKAPTVCGQAERTTRSPCCPRRGRGVRARWASAWVDGSPDDVVTGAQSQRAPGPPARRRARGARRER